VEWQLTGRGYSVVWASSSGLTAAETRLSGVSGLVSSLEHRLGDGFPVLVDPSGLPVMEVLGFFIARSDAAASSSAQYVRALARFCDFLEHKGIENLMDATSKDLATYRVYRTQTAARPISQYSFRVEASALRQFYSWAVEDGRLGRSPVRQLSRSGRDNLSTNRVRHTKIRHVDSRVCELWLKEVSGRKEDPAVRSARERNVAAFKTLVSTGLRIQELASLLTLDVDCGHVLTYATCIEMESITKFQVNRSALLPEYALAAISAYRKLERPNVVFRHQRSLAKHLDSCFVVDDFDRATLRVSGHWRGRRRKYDLHQVPVDMRQKAVSVRADGLIEPLCLFLSDSRGLGMTRSGWEGVFADVSERLLRRYADDLYVRKVTPHDLRHTFAINYLRAAHHERVRRRDESERADEPPLRDPMIDLQELLGHASSAQTLRYLRYVEDIDRTVAAAMPQSDEAGDDRASLG
jgi:site-specific recombinase XerD